MKVAIDRDKEVTKTILSENGVNVPMSHYTREYKDILKLINQESKKLFLKVRYGSMDNGITYYKYSLAKPKEYIIKNIQKDAQKKIKAEQQSIDVLCGLLDT